MAERKVAEMTSGSSGLPNLSRRSGVICLGGSSSAPCCRVPTESVCQILLGPSFLHGSPDSEHSYSVSAPPPSLARQPPLFSPRRQKQSMPSVWQLPSRTGACGSLQWATVTRARSALCEQLLHAPLSSRHKLQCSACRPLRAALQTTTVLSVTHTLPEQPPGCQCDAGWAGLSLSCSWRIRQTALHTRYTQPVRRVRSCGWH